MNSASKKNWVSPLMFMEGIGKTFAGNTAYNWSPEGYTTHTYSSANITYNS